jgi:hypothetical protein
MEDMKEITKLEKENKNLKEYNWELIENHKKDIDVLCEENKKLRERIDELESYREEIEKLKAPRNIRNSDEWRKTHPFG